MHKLTAEQADRQIAVLERAENSSMADVLGLWSWGKWARAEGGNLGYAKTIHFFSAKGWPEADLKKPIPDISDAEAMKIDLAVTGLPEPHKSIIVGVYKLWIPTRRIPGAMQISERQATKYENQALGMLYAVLTQH